MARKGMTDEEIVTVLRKAINDSEHMTDGSLAKERENVDRYYRGELPAPMHKGDSKYVSRDVFDIVDTARSTVVEAFSAHNRIVKFQPERGETVGDAKQATEYTRHVFFKENDGERLIYDAASEGLMKRFAIAKVYPKTTTDEDEYEFEGLTPEELTMTLEDFDNYEFSETDVSENGLFSGTFVVSNVDKKVCVELVQPEDFGISSREANIRASKYHWHRVEKSKSDLLREGYDKKLIETLTFRHKEVGHDWEKARRFEMTDDITSLGDTDDDSGQTTNVYEIYIRLDPDKTGKQKFWKYTLAEDVLLDREEISRSPFVAFVPLPIPHTFFGDNYASSVIPIQNARTVLIRQIINHSLITNNPRTQVLNGTVQNPNEITENRLGGIINVRRMDGIAPVMQAPLNPFVFNLIQMIDEDKEEVTGISKLSQGLNKDAISTQNAEGMVEQLIQASQQRTKTIVRQFASFVKELYLLIYETAIEHIDEAGFIDALGQYVEVNPSLWVHRSAASVELTLGYGELAKEAQKWVEIDSYFSQDPTLSAGYDYSRRYEVVSRGLEARGIEDIKALLTPPDEMQPPEPSEAEILQMEEVKTRIEYQKAQAQAMIAKAESDRMKAEADLIRARADAKRKDEESKIDAFDQDHKVWLDKEELKLAKATPKKTAILSPNH